MNPGDVPRPRTGYPGKRDPLLRPGQPDLRGPGQLDRVGALPLFCEAGRGGKGLTPLFWMMYLKCSLELSHTDGVACQCGLIIMNSL